MAEVISNISGEDVDGVDGPGNRIAITLLLRRTLVHQGPMRQSTCPQEPLSRHVQEIFARKATAGLCTPPEVSDTTKMPEAVQPGKRHYGKTPVEFFLSLYQTPKG